MKRMLTVVLWIAGCGSSSNPTFPPDAASDAAATFPDAQADDDGPDAGDDGDTPCNTVENTAPVVDVIQIAADPPQPQGGTIADGTYLTTAVAIYTGLAGPAGATGTSQTTAVIHGATVQMVSTGVPARRTLTLTTADAGFTAVDTCPEPQTSEGGYTATPTTLTIFLPGGTDDAGARTVVQSLARQ